MEACDWKTVVYPRGGECQPSMHKISAFILEGFMILNVAQGDWSYHRLTTFKRDQAKRTDNVAKKFQSRSGQRHDNQY